MKNILNKFLLSLEEMEHFFFVSLKLAFVQFGAVINSFQNIKH